MMRLWFYDDDDDDDDFTQELSEMKSSFVSVMQNILLTSNISLCSELRHISAPVMGTYKMTARVFTSGDLHTGDTIASVTTSSNANLSGGSIR